MFSESRQVDRSIGGGSIFIISVTLSKGGAGVERQSLEENLRSLLWNRTKVSRGILIPKIVLPRFLVFFILVVRVGPLVY